MSESLIHLRVPAATKGRWIRASRAEGMRLTDWIAKAVEAQMPQALTRYTIPDGIDFADLRLARDPDGAVSFDTAPLVTICEASGIDPNLMSNEDNASAMIMAWYAEHRRRGGAPDPVQDDLIAEVRAEERIGQTVSLPPGRA
ncbi:MAG: hypothetical protein CMK46_06845 [Porticoccus sp.]|nr:hypothetical protein [Rhodospirillaceae bacterium]MBG57991.1 hypothetical protein [Porticoccus sp.]QDP49905.1 MAG: hypothetical protein GOVbin132_49 [Prokaryotic dsDNA virus sp.]MAX61598.1 hypothetical protein [Rhodospirillaceae bacterium]MAX61663.1 hypothetical protein [Rhodospirillaceae bacterium]